MRIGELGQHTGVSTKTIRYYEDIALLPPPERTANGYRNYGDESVELLRFIRDAQATGLTLAEITAVVEQKTAGDSTCEHVLEMLEHHLHDIEAQIATLNDTRKKLVALDRRARSLDPADCTDPIRCQTIEANTQIKRLASQTALLHHDALHSHHE